MDRVVRPSTIDYKDEFLEGHVALFFEREGNIYRVEIPYDAWPKFVEQCVKVKEAIEDDDVHIWEIVKCQ
jgi:hypothetical protein